MSQSVEPNAIDKSGSSMPQSTAERDAQKKQSSEHSKPRYANLEEGTKFPQYLLNIGFVFALLLSTVCLFLSAYYLFNFLTDTNDAMARLITGADGKLDPASLRVAITGRLAMARFALISCGMFVGIAFGFLGFALFLLGIRNEVDASAVHENFQIKFVRLSPGLLVILCATVLVGICVTRSIDFSYRNLREVQRQQDNAPPVPTTSPDDLVDDNDSKP